MGSQTAAIERAGDAGGGAAPPPPGSKSGVYIVDAHPVIRLGVRAILDVQPDLAVSGEAETPEKALAEVGGVRPSLVLTELTFATGSRADFLADLKRVSPASRILVLSVLEELYFARRALLAGADGYIMKRQSVDELRIAIHQVILGGPYVGKRILDRLHCSLTGLRDVLEQTPLHPLSDGELSVFELLGAGLGTRDISRRLRRSPKTIETVRSRIMKKLGIENSTQLMRRAAASIRGMPDFA